MSDGAVRTSARITPERLAEALWDFRESIEPSGPLTGCTADDRSREPVFWKQAVEEGIWPGSRREALQEAAAVLRMLGEDS